VRIACLAVACLAVACLAVPAHQVYVWLFHSRPPSLCGVSHHARLPPFHLSFLASLPLFLPSISSPLRPVPPSPPPSPPSPLVVLSCRFVEARTHFGAWCIVSAPLVLGMDLRDAAKLAEVCQICGVGKVVAYLDGGSSAALARLNRATVAGLAKVSWRLDSALRGQREGWLGIHTPPTGW